MWWPFKNKYELYSGKIRIGDKKVIFKINFDKYNLDAIKKKIESTKDIGSIEFFKKWFNKLILPVIEHTVRTDELLARTPELKIVDIELSVKGIIYNTDFQAFFNINRRVIVMNLDYMIQSMQDYFDKGKYKTQIIVKALRHELTHYAEELRKYLRKGPTGEETIKNIYRETEVMHFSKDKEAQYFLVYKEFLKKSHEEGLAALRQYKHADKIKVYGAESLRNIAITKIVPNAYLIGRQMCMTIGLALLKKEKRFDEAKLIVDGKIISAEKINEVIKKNKIFYIMKLPEDIQKKTVDLVSRFDDLEFLKLYDRCCDILGMLKGSNRGPLRGTMYDILKKDFEAATEPAMSQLKKDRRAA